MPGGQARPTETGGGDPLRTGVFPVSNETLPAWTYDNAEFFALEVEAIFMRTWHIVGHVSELREPGDYLRFDLPGESVFVVRDADGALGAFYNVCRHRASRLVDGDAGHCGKAIRCRYHGWTYGLDGRLKSVPAEKSFPGLDKASIRLAAVEHEVWFGFVFIRFEPGGASVAEVMAPYAEELAAYRFEDLEPIGRYWGSTAPVDWKNAVDNNIEGYHIPLGHPGLQRLFGPNYGFETQPHGIARAGGRLFDKPTPNWSERHYVKLLPEVDHLPAERRRAWHYYSLFPNAAFDVYPDTIDFFQMIPAGPGRCRLRGRAYGVPDTRREMRAARYLGGRINRLVGQEDVALVAGVQAGLASRSYDVGLLSDKEQRIREFHSLIRALIPVSRSPTAPEPGSVARRNREMAAG